MSTVKQIEANRRNAQKSTGPRTDEGKAAVALNALQHGLYSASLLLPEEDQSRFDALCQEHADFYQPQNLEETDLVQEIVCGKWELIRFNLIKQGVFAKGRQWATKKANPQPELAQICLELGDSNGSSVRLLSTLNQMEGRIRRRIDRAKKELEKAREKQPQPESQPEEEVGQAIVPAAGLQPASEATPIPPGRAQDPNPAEAASTPRDARPLLDCPTKNV